MTTSTIPAPATQVRDAIISRLRNLSGTGLQASQIRSLLDVSADTPVGTESIIVTAADMGGHNGLPGRILIDIDVTVSIITHLDEDEDGARNDELEAIVMPNLAAIPAGLALNGWSIRFGGDWQGTDPAVVNETFRKRDLNATLYLQNHSS